MNWLQSLLLQRLKDQRIERPDSIPDIDSIDLGRTIALAQSEVIRSFKGEISQEMLSEGLVDRGMIFLVQAQAISAIYQTTGDDDLLTEIIDLERKALSLLQSGHPMRANSCMNLSISLYTRYQDTGHNDLLMETIELQRQSLSLCQSEHPMRASICHSLAVSLSELSQNTGDNHFLSEIIDLQREALSLRPPGHPERASSCMRLTNSLIIRYKLTSDEHVLLEIIDLQRELYSLFPARHPAQVILSPALARSLSTRYEVTGDVSLLKEAISLERLALCLCPPERADRSELCTNLAISLMERYKLTGDSEDVTKSIDLGREALSLCPPGHPTRAKCCVNLSTSLRTCYSSTGNDNLLVEAIELLREALSLFPPGHSMRASACLNLAVSLHTHFNTTGNEEILWEALNLDREAVSLRPPGHLLHEFSCGNLAGSLLALHYITGEERLLMEAINLQREALSVNCTTHPDRAIAHSNLGVSLMRRHLLTGDKRLLLESIDLHQAACDMLPPRHPDRALYCSNLAAALYLSFRATANDASLLIRIIRLGRNALSLCPPDHPNHADSCANLACYLNQYYHFTGDTDFLMEAIRLNREALLLRPPGHPDHAISGHNSARSLSTLFNHTGNRLLLSDIYQLGKESLSAIYPDKRWRPASLLAWLHLQPETTMFNSDAAIGYLHECLMHHPDNAPDAVSNIGSCLELIRDSVGEMQLDQHVALTSIYRWLVRLLPFLAHPVLGIPVQLQILRRANQIASDLFINSVFAGNWQMGLEDMEFVQGFLWSQRLHYRDPQLQDIPLPLADRLKNHMQGLTISGGASGDGYSIGTKLTPQDIQHNHATQVYATLKEIRAISGLDRFMLGATYAELCMVAHEHPIIILIYARDRAFAVLLSSASDIDNNVLLPLDWSETDYKNALAAQPTSSRYAADDFPPPSSVSAAIDPKRAIKKNTSVPPTSDTRRMRYLWLKVVKPVLDKLGIQPAKGRDRPRLYWYPTGAFSTVPCHAAGIYDGPLVSHVSCADYVVSSYTPTISSLHRVQKSRLPLSTNAARVALVAEKQSQEKHLGVINGVVAEMDNIVKIAQANCLDLDSVYRLSSPTTITDTCAAIKTSHILHLACHGVQDREDATESGFCLGDGRLTISKLMELDLDNAFLAFLSACETATGDVDQPDQAMHLAAAMLFAGFKSVIATMWSISDIDGPKVATWFYEELFAKDIINADDVAYALDAAVDKLRKDPEGVSLERWAPFIHMGA